MKQIVLIIGLVLLAASFGFLGCAGTSSKTAETSVAAEHAIRTLNMIDGSIQI